MPTAPCCTFSALLPGAEPFPRYPSGWSFLYRSQSSNGNGIPSYLVGPIQHFSANYVFAGSHIESEAGFYQRDAPYLLSF